MNSRLLRRGLQVILILIISASLLSCKNTQDIETGGEVTESQVESQEESQEKDVETSVNRYEEIINTSGDKGKLSIYFIDLPESHDDDKSGDSTLLISPEGKVMLIDSGHTDSVSSVIKLLEDLNIKKIDYFVASHPHIDHVGGFPAIAERFEIGTAYRSHVEYTTNTYFDYINILKRKRIPVVYLQEGDEFSFGDEIHIKVYNPGAEIEYPKEFPANSTQFINDNSIVMKFAYGDSTILFSGDIYMSQERDLVRAYKEELQADLIKANHHGADTSNSVRWIKNAQAKYVIAMNDTVDGMSVYQNYVDEGAIYYNTSLNGFVKAIVDKNKNYTISSQYDSWLNETVKE